MIQTIRKCCRCTILLPKIEAVVMHYRLAAHDFSNDFSIEFGELQAGLLEAAVRSNALRTQ